jgi:ribonuclease I
VPWRCCVLAAPSPCRPSEEDPTGNDLSESLWQHEWAVHGTCTGLTQSNFLNTALNLTAGLHTPSAISSHIGGSVSRSTIESAYNNGAACGTGSCMVFLQCDDSDYLLSVITCWSTALKQMECPKIVTGASDRCSSGNVKITAFS